MSPSQSHSQSDSRSPGAWDDPVAAVLAGVERLQRVGNRLWQTVEDELGLSEVHAQALTAIAAQRRTVSHVADACGRHVSSASRIVDQLVQRDLVTRVEDAEDRRAVRLGLTATGRQAVERIEQVHHTALERSLARLGEEDAADLARLLSRLADAAEETAEV